jgi:hypothetical protein
MVDLGYRDEQDQGLLYGRLFDVMGLANPEAQRVISKLSTDGRRFAR